MITDLRSLIRTLPIYTDKITSSMVSDISPAVLDSAERFLLVQMPAFYRKIITTKNITVTPHGTIVFDWLVKKDLVTVEIGETKIFFFASLPDGTIKESIFEIGDKIPEPIIKALDAVYGRS